MEGRMTREEMERFVVYCIGGIGEIKIIRDLDKYDKEVKLTEVKIRPEIKVESTNGYVIDMIQKVLDCGIVEELSNERSRWTVRKEEEIRAKVIPVIERNLFLSGEKLWLDDIKDYIDGKITEEKLVKKELCRKEKGELYCELYYYRTPTWYEDIIKLEKEMYMIKEKYEKNRIPMDPIRIAAYISIGIIEFRTDIWTGGPGLRGVREDLRENKLGTEAILLRIDLILYDLEAHFKTKRILPDYNPTYNKIRVKIGNSVRFRLLLGLIGGKIVGPPRIDFLKFKWYTEDFISKQKEKKKKKKVAKNEAEERVEYILQRAEEYKERILELEEKRTALDKQNVRIVDFRGFDHINKRLPWIK